MLQKCLNFPIILSLVKLQNKKYPMNVCLLPLISLLPAVNKTKRQSVDRSETFEKLEKKEEKVTLKEEEKKNRFQKRR